MTDIQSYTPILKTTTAELRGVRELEADIKDQFTPVFELTKSRKTKKLKEGDINRQLEHTKNSFSGRPMILDLTGNPNYQNSQIKKLQTSDGGYRAWVRFLTRKKSEIPGLIPVLQVTDEDVDTEKEYYDRLRLQAGALGRRFDRVVFRIPIDYEDYGGDVSAIAEGLSLEQLVAIVDADFIPQNKSSVYGDAAARIVLDLNERGVGQVAVAGSSFPLNPTQFGEDTEGQFNLEEVRFYRYVTRKPDVGHVTYSDYATVHPQPSLQAGGRGWVARIDLPCEDTIWYQRSRKEKSEKTYTNAYSRVGFAVASLPEFADVTSLTGTCWGIEQIEMAAEGYPPGLSPSFWISVRINTHINVRLATAE